MLPEVTARLLSLSRVTAARRQGQNESSVLARRRGCRCHWVVCGHPCETSTSFRPPVSDVTALTIKSRAQSGGPGMQKCRTSALAKRLQAVG